MVVIVGSKICLRNHQRVCLDHTKLFVLLLSASNPISYVNIIYKYSYYSTTIPFVWFDFHHHPPLPRQEYQDYVPLVRGAEGKNLGPRKAGELSRNW